MIGLFVTIFSLSLVIGCSGSSGSSGGSGGSGGESSGGGIGNSPRAEWTVVPFTGGLSIEWHNLASFNQTDDLESVSINITKQDSAGIIHSINITDFIDGVYNLTSLGDGKALEDGVAYKFNSLILEYSDHSSHGMGIHWLWGTNRADHGANGTVVGRDHDRDGWSVFVDTDNDDDGMLNDEDLCPLGEVGWLSNKRTDNDGDGCQDKGEMNNGWGEDRDDDNDGLMDNHPSELLVNADGISCSLLENCDDDYLVDREDSCPNGERDWSNNGTKDHDGDGCRDDSLEDLDDDNDGVLDDDEMEGCGLNVDCDHDEVLDGDEVIGCELKSDCDDDGVLDGDEVMGCELKPDCDDDEVLDGDEVMGCELKPDCDNDTVLDRDEAMGCELKPDCDNDTVLDRDEAMGCELKPDCDNDTVLDRDEVMGCVLKADCDDDEVLDGDEVIGCELKADCDDDGVLDRDEVVGCALKPDCDDDGVLDRDEVVGCALKPDCDDDGVVDSQEISGCILKQDCDDDSQIDSVDIDGDGDGLIEIRNARELDAMRFVLSGEGFKQDAGAILDQTGCGGSTAVTQCSGYELVADISLTDYIADTYPMEGWQPIAHDTDPNNNRVCDGDIFTGTFDGNGFVVSGLLINRSNEDCIGLFGQADGMIRNLGIVADRVIGRDYIGILVGDGEGIEVIQSYGVGDEVRGRGWVGGLVGLAEHGEIIQSYAVSSEVRGSGKNIGGLVGLVDHGKIIQSYAVSSLVHSTANYLGGLIGYGVGAIIYHSYAVNGQLRGASVHTVGGLVGWGASRVDHAYWDNQTSGQTTDIAESRGSKGQDTMALRSPTGYDKIYDLWDDGLAINGIDYDSTIWCDEDLSGTIEIGEMRSDNHIWDFGTATDYPAIRCMDDGLTDQRDWWYINASHKLQFNQTRLDAWLAGSLP